MAAVAPNVNVNNNPAATNININNLNNNVNNVNNLANLASNAHLATQKNQIISHNLLDEVKFFETFSTYKIFTLELISVYCSIRKNKIKFELMKNDIFTETPLDTSASSMLSQQLQLKDYDIMPNQELKIINIILKAVKTADLSVNDLLQSIIDSDMQLFLKLISDRIECLSKHTVLELRNLINDLKIYFIGPPLNDPLIRPWSVVGKYVRRCIIIYEKMSFDKIVNLCKEASIQFKYNLILSNPGAEDEHQHGHHKNDAKDPDALLSVTQTTRTVSSKPAASRNVCFAESNTTAENNAHTDELDHNNSPMSGALFLHDESNLTVTSDIFNRSTTVDCSGIGMDLDESLSQSLIMHTNNMSASNANNNAANTSLNVSNNRDFLNKFLARNSASQKALTSTVSAQRTMALNNLKSSAGPVLPSLADTSGTETVPKSVTFAKKLLSKDDHGILNSPILEGSIIMPTNPPPAALRQKSIDGRGLGQLPATKPTTGHHGPSNLSYSFSLTNGCAFSRKIAEFFVAQQVRLLENNEHDALSPVELQQKIDELIAYDSSFADAYYLKYLNYLRLRDYTLALKSLHDYFDRLILDDSTSLAALNLCSLEYRFENKENAFFALKEAITSAHQESDNSCLQHCLSWLYKMEPYSNSNSRKNFLIRNACSRGISNEVYNLAAYNLHYFARNSIGKHKPSAILNLINKTEIINLKMNSRLEITLLSECHKAALWNLYGHKKLCNLHSQIVLNLVPTFSSIKLNTESQCIAICYLALNFCNNGHYQASQSLIDYCKEIYSTHSKTSEHWKLTENIILIEKNLLGGKWSQARSFIEKLAVISIQQALLYEMNIYILEGNLDKAKEIGNRILLSMNTSEMELFQNNPFDLNNNTQYFSGLNNGASSQFEFLNDQISISLRFNYIQLYIALNEYPNALISAIKFHHEIKQLDLNYDFMISCMLIAKILIHMEHPEQAIKYLEKCIIFIFSNGSLVDQAKLHYLYAKCLHILDKKKNLVTSIDHMKKCVEKLESIQGSIYLLSAYAYLSLLLNEADNTLERNKYAHKFRQLRQQLPLIGYLL